MDFKPHKISIGSVSVDTAKDAVIGREELVAKLWKTIDLHSVRLLSERRMGKTWVLKLALATKPKWAKPIFFDAEGVHSTHEFVLALNKELHKSGIIKEEKLDAISDWFRRQAQKVAGTSIAGVDVPSFETWKDLLKSTCEHFTKSAGSGHKAVLMIDELPFFLDNLIAAGQPLQAIEFLDALRYIRQTHPSFRLLTCGSLGLHIVFDKLRSSNYTGQPMNDMPPFEVTPLDYTNATYLAGCLLLGQKIQCSDTMEVAAAVAKAGSCVPFYIQHITEWMTINGTGISWTPESAYGVLNRLFEDPGDPAELKYYDTRLDQYYPEDIVDKARAILDVLARNEKGIDFNELLNFVRHFPKTQTIDPQQLLKSLDILRNDHYIVQKDGHSQFKLEIVRKSWLAKRGGAAS